ncbi:MAG: glycosyltransferase family 4 protein [Verrucomicrobiota bacterium]|nr:glycosyltransferase family 4 protein [Verrucomicrobiota bacterium]
MVLLIGNYPPDEQQSMQRFSKMMLAGLMAAGVPAELIQPQPVFGRIRLGGSFVRKWLAYLDKFFLFPRSLRARLQSAPAIVHICDHSNAMYAKHAGHIPVVVTCHDMLAVRGALGENTDTPASFTGKFLQRWILSGLRRASAVSCVSLATSDDARRLVGHESGQPKIDVIPLGLSYPYKRLERGEAMSRLAAISGFDTTLPFVLHVGSNLRRKNREVTLRVFARCKDEWNGQLVFVGDRLNESLTMQAETLGIAGRIVQLGSRANEQLEALYNLSTALLFPSRFEGFGWPIIEAQACGCPVLCSSEPPMPEVAGRGALLRAPDDEAGFAQDLLRLTNENEHAHWSELALANATRYTAAEMISRYRDLYASLAPVC